MSDLIYLVLTLVFFLITYGFITVCEQLMEDKS